MPSRATTMAGWTLALAVVGFVSCGGGEKPAEAAVAIGQGGSSVRPLINGKLVPQDQVL